MRAGSRAETFSGLAASYRSVGIRAPQGVSEARRGLRYDGGLCRNRKIGRKSDQKSFWKSGEERVRLYTWPRAGLADEAGSDAILEAAGGEGGHGAARPDRVIHRYILNEYCLRNAHLPVC